MNLQPRIYDQPYFVDRPGESVLSTFEKCLNNGLGVSFVVEQVGKLAGRHDLEGLRRTFREGALLTEDSLANLASRIQSSSSAAARRSDSVRPVLDNGSTPGGCGRSERDAGPNRSTGCS